MKVRHAAYAGTFYPADPARLRADVMAMLRDAHAPHGAPPRAIIAPHAGYVYSGPVAASAYAALAPMRGAIERVVLVGPSHRQWFAGMGLSSADAWETPLGAVPCDANAAAALAEMPDVSPQDAAHAREHSLEVHLPFLQVCLDDFALVPLIVGDAAPETVGRVLEAAWSGPETLLVVSTDLSHYHAEDAARVLDDATAADIGDLRYERLAPERACGAIPIQGLLWLARRRGLTVDLLSIATSADTAGPRDAVVGYASFAVT